MKKIDNIIKLMGKDLTAEQKDKLKNVLEVELHDNHCNKTNAELMTLFLDSKKITGRQDSTLKQYRIEIQNLMKYSDVHFSEMTADDIRKYLIAYQKSHNISQLTIANKMKYLSSFFEFLKDEEIAERNPIRQIDNIKVEKKIKKSFSAEELESLRDNCKNLRERALIETLYSTGVRVSELSRMDVKDIDFAAGEIIVMGKGAKERKVYLSDSAKFHLKKYLESRKAASTDPLFCHFKGNGRLTDRSIEKSVHDLGVRSKVDKVHPHKFRRTMATDLLSKGMPIEQVKEVLDHDSIDTTMIYCNVKDNNVKSSFQKCFL